MVPLRSSLAATVCQIPNSERSSEPAQRPLRGLSILIPFLCSARAWRAPVLEALASLQPFLERHRKAQTRGAVSVVERRRVDGVADDLHSRGLLFVAFRCRKRRQISRPRCRLRPGFVIRNPDSLASTVAHNLRTLAGGDQAARYRDRSAVIGHADFIGPMRDAEGAAGGRRLARHRLEAYLWTSKVLSIGPRSFARCGGFAFVARFVSPKV
jgi:hypothetical protein